MKKRDLLKALKVKEEKYIVVDTNPEIELTLKGFVFDELAEYSDLVDTGNNKAALDFTIFKVFRSNLPTIEEDSEEGFTDDEIRNLMRSLPAKPATEILTRMQEISGLTASKKDKEKQEAEKELIIPIKEKA